jgi:aconitate hydratase
MTRGTFGNIRIKNKLLPGVEGGDTLFLPDGERMSIFDAAMKYKAQDVPLLVLAGKEYGTGSSRDWAAKGTFLLGVKAVLARSYERIHRSNLIGMGVLPLEFLPQDSVESLGLDGHEVFELSGLEQYLAPNALLDIRAMGEDHRVEFKVRARLDTLSEVETYRHGGILKRVLREMAG